MGSRVGRGGDLDGFAVDQDLPAVRAPNPGNDADQS